MQQFHPILAVAVVGLGQIIVCWFVDRILRDRIDTVASGVIRGVQIGGAPPSFLLDFLTSCTLGWRPVVRPSSLCVIGWRPITLWGRTSNCSLWRHVDDVDRHAWLDAAEYLVVLPFRVRLAPSRSRLTALAPRIPCPSKFRTPSRA